METEDKKPCGAIVEIVEGGKLKISGNLVFRDLKRDITLNLEEVSLCLCGRSKNKPYCDNSHSGIQRTKKKFRLIP